MAALIRVELAERRDRAPTPGQVSKVDVRVRHSTGTKINAGGTPRSSGVIPDNIGGPPLECVQCGVVRVIQTGCVALEQT